MIKNYHSIFKIPLVLTIGLLICNSCKDQQTTASEETQPVTVELFEVGSRSKTTTLDLSGNVEAETMVRLGFMVAGKVAQISTDEGETIKKGNILARLDDSDYRIGLSAAEGKLLEVKDQYDRLKIMHDRKSISEADFMKISAGLQQAQAQYDLRLKQVNDTRLIAPITGVLLKKGVSEGEILDKGLPVFAIGNIDNVKISTAVPESEIRNVKIGQTATVRIFALDTFFTGTITEVGKAAEPSTRTYTAQIEIKNPDHQILPGMIASATIQGPSSNPEILIPLNAISQMGNNEHSVYVLDETSKKIYRRRISVGKIVNDSISVSSGIRPGEKVVTGSTQNLTNGMLTTH
ncbi:efflux RND transporter periplasmic adaptor subunit [Robertkochia solimangrovi]|uniref:efflux RND transporter periplasmic adaptor subunit n=1 Tax=Robertkochia solimangrovi TaxID=2213046 RepID=UPI00117DE132|nr:efflux RND transporter periplasmic adaptor subunit [Robertkochia solimangrovi]TRZ42593.1 efflux RND transporter periplasmic adaptor subunit [Robertkochia solimangrovi]